MTVEALSGEVLDAGFALAVQILRNCKTTEVLLSGYLDGEVTQQDRQRVEVHLDDCSSCRTTFNELTALRSSIRKLAFPSMSNEQKESMMNSPMAKGSQRLGWLLIIAGTLIAGGFGMWKPGEELLRDPEVPHVVTLAILGLYAGFGFLLLSAGLHRLKAYRTDRYKDVEL